MGNEITNDVITETIPISWAAKLRKWYDELFPNYILQLNKRYTNQLREEISYLRNELSQARINNDVLQRMLNQVNPAGLVSHRLNNPPTQHNNHDLPASSTRWSQLETERYALIERKRIEKLTEIQSKTAKAA